MKRNEMKLHQKNQKNEAKNTQSFATRVNSCKTHIKVFQGAIFAFRKKFRQNDGFGGENMVL